MGDILALAALRELELFYRRLQIELNFLALSDVADTVANPKVLALAAVNRLPGGRRPEARAVLAPYAEFKITASRATDNLP